LSRDDNCQSRIDVVVRSFARHRRDTEVRDKAFHVTRRQLFYA
jgi:hypothetical protein